MTNSDSSYLYKNGVLSEYYAQQSTNALINLYNWAKQKEMVLEVGKVSDILCGYDYKSYDVLSQIRGDVSLHCK